MSSESRDDVASELDRLREETITEYFNGVRGAWRLPLRVDRVAGDLPANLTVIGYPHLR